MRMQQGMPIQGPMQGPMQGAQPGTPQAPF
jgi:hypothetical protein